MSQPQQCQINANGVKLRLRQWSPDKSPCVVLVHGYPDSSHIWDRVATLLAQRFHVVAYDVRGAGESDAPKHTQAYKLVHLAADFRAVIDTVSPAAPVHLVAHDWGSIQSWESVTDAAMAQRIASYTSISGPCLDHAGYWIAQRLKSGKPDDLAQVAGQLAHSWYIGAFHLPVLAPGLWKAGLDRVWPSVLARLEGVPATVNPTQKADGAIGVKLYRANFRERLLAPQSKRTDVPVQLVVPLDDPFVTVSLLDELHQWAPRLWRVDVKAGHWLPASHPELVAERVTQFAEFIDSGVAEAKAPVALRRARVTGPRLPLSGKLAVITGAGSGIGRETLLSLAELGCEVVAADINADGLQRSVELARLLGAKAHGRQLDVGDAKAWQRFSVWVEKHLGTADILVNNAGIGMAGGFLETTAEDWDRLLKVNLNSVIHGASLFARQMVAAGVQGTIVNVASAAAFMPTRTLPAYATSKAAVRMLSDCMRADLVDKHIHVVTVCPGIINTGITDRTRFVGHDDAAEQHKRDKTSRLYARRNLGPKKVAEGIVRAILEQRDEVLVGAEAWGMNLLGRFAPRLARRLAQLDPTA